MSRSWYEIQNAAAAEADIYLYNEIGYWGVTAQSFVDALNTVKAKVINLFVNSPGGSVDDGMAIFNALSRHPATVNSTVDGLAASSASFIVQAADGKRSMGKGSTMMIHEPHLMAMGDAETMAKAIEMLNTYGENIAGIYAGRAGGSVEDWRQKMRAETWFKAQDAVDAGLADDMVGATGASNLSGRVFNVAKYGYRHIPKWAQVKNEDMAECAVPDCGDGVSMDVALCAGHGAQMMEMDKTIGGMPLQLLTDLGSEFRKSASYTPEPTLEELFQKQATSGGISVGLGARGGD